MKTERGRYFEEFEIGDTFVTQARTVTETDIVNFAGLSGDFNALHMDVVSAESSPYNQRIAHGLLVQSIASGLANRIGFIDGTVIGFRHLTCKFSRPVFIGDTLHVVLTVTEKKRIQRIQGGNVTFNYRVLNQNNEAVQKGDWVIVVKHKTETESLS